MKFREIEDTDKVYPGEYLLHKPSNQIVICGAFMKSENKIKALSNGRLMIDDIATFNKIVLNKNERKTRRATRCKGCSG
jgi:hypothetical protein